MNESTVKWLNELEQIEAKVQFRKCCGAEAWALQMVAQRPYTDVSALRDGCEKCFDELTHSDWLEAFHSHPRIGERDSLPMRLAGNRQWSSGEQAGITSADESTLKLIADGNMSYDERFGYPYIVCATGKSAVQMCELLYQRLNNDAFVELEIACDEQRKITRLRLKKLAPPVDESNAISEPSS
jgi:2-oxo-4-hydroxy-4-carboxy-5-ureidoimidazoline decarboxylase